MLQLRALRHIVVLAEHLNYARAAEALGLSQSALSRSIQTLEAQLGMRVFDRDRGGVALTPHGQSLVERASVLLTDADDLEQHIARNARGEAGRIRFGIAPMPARALLSRALSDRLTVAPDVTNEVVVRDSDALWTLLVAGEIEFFISQDGLLPASSLPRVDLIGHFPLALIVRAGHPLLQDDRAKMTYPVIRSSRLGLPLPPEIQEYARGASNVIEDFGSLAALTAATDAIWFSSTYAVTADLVAGKLHELPRPANAPVTTVRVVMYSLARRSLSPLAAALKAAFRQQVRVLASEMAPGRQS